MMQYAAFLDSKRPIVTPGGVQVSPADLSPRLFPYQRDVVTWALRLGKAALFEERGLGKTIQQCEWASVVHAHTGGREPSPLCAADKYVLLVTPRWLYLPLVKLTGEAVEYRALFARWLGVADVTAEEWYEGLREDWRNEVARLTQKVI